MAQEADPSNWDNDIDFVEDDDDWDVESLVEFEADEDDYDPDEIDFDERRMLRK